MAPAICGHRGAPAIAPENTIEGFAAARLAGATWLEFDVRPTRDRQLVVHHDPVYVDQDTGVNLDIGQTGAADLPASIPTLADVVQQFGDLTLDIELKTDETGTDAATYVELAADEIQGLVAQRLADPEPDLQVLVTSFDADVLRSFRERCVSIPTGFLYTAGSELTAEESQGWNQAAVEHAIDVGHQAVVPHHRLVTPDLVRRAHDNGLQVATWTVNTESDIRRCALAGVDVLIGDDPRLIGSTLQAL